MSTFVSSPIQHLTDPFDVAHNMIFDPEEAVRVTLYDNNGRESSDAYMTLEHATRLRDALTWAIDMGKQ